MNYKFYDFNKQRLIYNGKDNRDPVAKQLQEQINELRYQLCYAEMVIECNTKTLRNGLPEYNFKPRNHNTKL
tara:strand:- start:29 stop:244 length:216 start_codon:yes stop_codon:yes gene_type:complete